MEPIRKEVYGSPVHTFPNVGTEDEEVPPNGESVDAGEYDVNRPESDDERRVIVAETESQTGPNKIKVRLDDPDRPRTEDQRFAFRITDTEKNRCTYTGDDDDEVPVDVFHAVYTFGYSIEDNKSHGDWFTYRVETQTLITALQSELPEDNRIIPEMGFRTAQLINIVDLGLLLRYISAVRNMPVHQQVWDNIFLKLSDGESMTLDLQLIYDEIIQFVEEAGYEKMVGEDVEDDEKAGLMFGIVDQTISTSDGEYIAIDILTEFGGERFLFQKTGEDTCNYVPRDDLTRPSPHAISRANELGYTVTNAESVFNSPLLDKIVTGLEVLNILENSDFTGAEPDTAYPANKIVSLAQDHLDKLLRAIVTYQYDPKAYTHLSEQILSELNNSTEEFGPLSMEDLASINLKIMELHPNEDSETEIVHHYLKKHPDKNTVREDASDLQYPYRTDSTNN